MSLARGIVKLPRPVPVEPAGRGVRSRDKRVPRQRQGAEEYHQTWSSGTDSLAASGAEARAEASGRRLSATGRGGEALARVRQEHPTGRGL